MEKRKLSTRRRETVAPPPKPPADQRTLASGDAVGDKLRAMFKAVEAAPVPNELTRLVEELERQRRRRRPLTN